MVRLALVTPVAICLWAAVLTLLERKFPYLPGYKVFRAGFWTDLFWYALVQSYLLALVIALIIRTVDGISGLSEHRLVRDWPIGLRWGSFSLYMTSGNTGSTGFNTGTFSLREHAPSLAASSAASRAFSRCI